MFLHSDGFIFNLFLYSGLRVVNQSNCQKHTFHPTQLLDNWFVQSSDLSMPIHEDSLMIEK